MRACHNQVRAVSNKTLALLVREAACLANKKVLFSLKMFDSFINNE